MEGGDKKKIMVAIDESECGRFALEWTLKNLSDSMEESKLVVFTAQLLSDVNYLYASPLGYARPDFVKTVCEKQKKMAFALLEEAKDIGSKYGVFPEAFTKAGDPQEAICEAAENLHIELLVMGSHGRKG